ncbi:preprotein translocase subunit SecE [bacterium]|nr:preprotein translocase subunit SecE [bacterium]
MSIKNPDQSVQNDVDAVRAVSVKDYFRELKAELKNVEWPTRDRVVKAAGVVLSICVISSVFVAILDYALTWMVLQIDVLV